MKETVYLHIPPMKNAGKTHSQNRCNGEILCDKLREYGIGTPIY